MTEQNKELIDILNQMNEEKSDATGTALAQVGESFPVLKAFQEYLETERRKMRQRTAFIIAGITTGMFAVIIILCVMGMIFINGMNKSQLDILDKIAGFSDQQRLPVRAPATVDIARELEDMRRKLLEDMKRELQNEKTAGELEKSQAKIQELMAQNKKLLETMEEAARTADAVKQAEPAKVEEAPPQPPPLPPTVGPVGSRDDHPDIDAHWDQKREGQDNTGLFNPKPRPPRPAAQDDKPQAAEPLKLEFTDSGAAEKQPATLQLPAPDGSTANWRLVIPGNE